MKIQSFLDMLKKLKEVILGELKKPETPRPKNTQPSEMYVYLTLKGKKFHYTQSCPGLHGAKTYKMALSKAKKGGYKACDKCCYRYLHD